MFGRKKKTDVDEETTSFFGDENDESVEIDEVEDDLEVTGDEFGDESEGPYDISEIDSDDPTAGRDGQRLDLGSVLVPMPTGRAVAGRDGAQRFAAGRAPGHRARPHHGCCLRRPEIARSVA